MREIDAVEEEVKNVHKHMKGLQSQGELNYFRFNPKLVAAVDSMQNTSAKNIIALRKDALDYIAENESEIQRFIDAIS